jgi:hypothetical protein
MFQNLSVVLYGYEPLSLAQQKNMDGAVEDVLGRDAEKEIWTLERGTKQECAKGCRVLMCC